MDGDVVERRQSDRVESTESTWDRVRLRTGHEISLINVSSGGALVETSARLLPGTAIVLHVTKDQRTMALRARVTRCHVSAIIKDRGVLYHCALAFADPLAGQRDDGAGGLENTSPSYVR